MPSPALGQLDSPDVQAETDLARRVTEGDPKAEAELCSRLLPRITVWARMRTRDDSRAADLAQEVMVVTLEKLRANQIENLDRLTGYVAGVCRNTWQSWRRGQYRQAELLEQHGVVLQGVQQPTEPLDRQRLADCFEKLNPRARTMLALTFFAQRSAEQIAEELATTAGALRVARHRALTGLQRCLDGEAA